MTKTIPPRITFAVDPVTPASELLPECKAYEAMTAHLGSDIESCCDYHGNVVKDVHYHALLAAVYKAFSEHRPLVLSPDMIWITILQGLAQHMTIHAERLRPNFVRHEGRKPLIVRVDDFVKGTPENPWTRAFAGWSDQIRAQVGTDLHESLVCNFSTTGPVERAVSEIVLMDIFERYFHYAAVCICGIPEVTLEGTVDDWQALRTRVEHLKPFDIDWWLIHLRPMCDEFVEAAAGRMNLEHWQNICKLREEYGGHIINGWIAKLFPYLREFVGGPARRKNPVFETGAGFQTFMAPTGLSKVPFVWRIEPAGIPAVEYQMEAVGGFIGIEQNQETKALRPKVGWAVREVSGEDALASRLAREHRVFQGIDLSRRSDGETTANSIDTSSGSPGSIRTHSSLPEDMARFYFATNGSELFAKEDRALFRILRFSDLSIIRVDGIPLEGEFQGNPPKMCRFCLLDDGTFLAIDLAHRRTRLPEARAQMRSMLDRWAARAAAEEDRIRMEMDRWAAARPKKPSLRDVNRRAAELRQKSPILMAMREELAPLRSQVQYKVNFVIHYGQESGDAGRRLVIAETFTEFLSRTLNCDGRIWWEQPGFSNYGDFIERLAEQ